MNESNLIPLNKRTKDEQRKITSMGGKASGKARRDKKMLKDCIEILLAKKMDSIDPDSAGKKVTGAEAISTALFLKALEGDTKAFEVLRDTAGQKIPDKIMVANVEQSVIDEVEEIVRDITEEDIEEPQQED